MNRADNIEHMVKASKATKRGLAYHEDHKGEHDRRRPDKYKNHRRNSGNKVQ